MHRWHFQRLIRWLVPILLYLGLLCIIIGEQKSSGIGLTFADDAAFTHHAVARSLIDHQTYGLGPKDYIPAVRDVPWRLALAATTMITQNDATATYLLGAVMGIIIILTVLKMARLLFPFPLYITYTTILLVLAPSMAIVAVDGGANLLATVLVLGSCMLHIEGLSNRRGLLPPASAVLIGFAAWIRIEFVFLWLVLWLHALITVLLRSDQQGQFLYAVIRGLTGLLIFALCLFPIFIWNYLLMGVAWPRMIGAPLSLDLFATHGAAATLKAGLSMSLGNLPAAYGKLFGIPFLDGLVGKLFAILGLIVLSGLACWRREERPYTLIPFLAVFLPVVCALLYPYVGWGNIDFVYESLSPLFVLVAAFGIFRVPFFIEGIYRKIKEGLPTASGFNIWWLVMGLVLFTSSIWRTSTLIEDRLTGLKDSLGVRHVISKTLDDLPVDGRVFLTDEPGWLAYAYPVRIMDLNGELSAVLLTCLDSSGDVDMKKLEKLLEDYQPDYLMYRDARFSSIPSVFSCRDIILEDGHQEMSLPHFCEMRWPDAH